MYRMRRLRAALPGGLSGNGRPVALAAAAARLRELFAMCLDLPDARAGAESAAAGVSDGNEKGPRTDVRGPLRNLVRPVHGALAATSLSLILPRSLKEAAISSPARMMTRFWADWTLPSRTTSARKT